MNQYPQYIDLLGAIIRQAIKDYQTINPENRTNGVYYKSAKFFLFSKNGLEGFLQRIGVEQFLNVEYIRKMADKIELNGISQLTKGRGPKLEVDNDNYSAC